MTLFKPSLDEIEPNGAFWTLWLIGILSCFVALIAVTFNSLNSFMQSLFSSLIGVLIAVYFINYRVSNNQKKHKEEYLHHLYPVLRRLFLYLFIDLSKIVTLNGKRFTSSNYKEALENSNRLVLEEERLEWFKTSINYKYLFGTYQRMLINQTTIHSNFLPENLTLNISEIIERVDSLMLQMKLEDRPLVLKNIAAIFRNMYLIDKYSFGLNFNK